MLQEPKSNSMGVGARGCKDGSAKNYHTFSRLYMLPTLQLALYKQAAQNSRKLQFQAILDTYLSL